MTWLGVALALTAGMALAARLASRPSVRASAPPPPVAAPPPRETEAHAATDDAPLPVLLGPADASPPPDTAPLHSPARLIQGPMEEVLYGGASQAPANVIAQALALFAHKLDLTRDLALGDQVRLLVRRTPDGETLDYAEADIARGPVRLYRVEDTGDPAAAFVDETGGSLRRLLLRTPLAHPRLTSGFGMRFHPLLGYSRMHQGVDFGAPVGTPVLAAGDGMVERVGWAGGYGRLVRLRHADGFATGYAHLSAWAPGLSPGVQVRQGQVIGWTGQSGLATGPHLHFEVLQDGRPIDPATAAPPAPPPSPTRLAAFEARRQAINRYLPLQAKTVTHPDQGE